MTTSSISPFPPQPGSRARTEHSLDAWRPVAERYLDPTAEVGAALAAGAIVTASDSGEAHLDAQIGDRIQVSAQCPAEATAEGARFVLVPAWRLERSNEVRDDWGWTIGDGRYHPIRTMRTAVEVARCP